MPFSFLAAADNAGPVTTTVSTPKNHSHSKAMLIQESFALSKITQRIMSYQIYHHQITVSLEEPLPLELQPAIHPAPSQGI